MNILERNTLGDRMVNVLWVHIRMHQHHVSVNSYTPFLSEKLQKFVVIRGHFC